ncbi:hypothetical protein KN1_09120 [Stygiolobus caldivivus]|uniref:Transposase n=1 Tax=Stygiolobus caldivivus TaxID=2824673 RepID=A0A8D5ZIQ8_9CREN|nr:hypothetical protein KN1_09120 [Stygiolobus caldivivus]
MKNVKHEKFINNENELHKAKNEFIKAFNFLVGILVMAGLNKRTALSLALTPITGGRASIRNTSKTFQLNYPNLLEALERLENAWEDYLQTLRKQITGPVIVITDDTFDHKPYSRVKGTASKHGNYYIWCSTHAKYEPGVQVLTIAIHDLTTGKTYLVGAFPYTTRKTWESGMVN